MGLYAVRALVCVGIVLVLALLVLFAGWMRALSLVGLCVGGVLVFALFVSIAVLISSVQHGNLRRRINMRKAR